MNKLEDRNYSVAEVALLFNVNRETIKLWLTGKQSHQMNGIKIKGKWAIPAAEIVRYANLLYGSTL